MNRARHARLRTALDGLTAWPLARLLETTDVDWIVCTHFLPAAVTSTLKARGRLRGRLAVVVTDFDAHGLWVVPHVDRYFVALEKTRQHLARLGVPAAQITVSGSRLIRPSRTLGTRSQWRASTGSTPSGGGSWSRRGDSGWVRSSA
jgi:processive 1,2-diacylglycerol beta-glucosyltransferase